MRFSVASQFNALVNLYGWEYLKIQISVNVNLWTVNYLSKTKQNDFLKQKGKDEKKDLISESGMRFYL